MTRCEAEYYQYREVRWDTEFITTLIQQGLMDTYVDLGTYLELNPRGAKDNKSLDYEAFGFNKLVEFCKKRYPIWKNPRMMPGGNGGFDARVDEFGIPRRVEIKTRLYPIESVLYNFEPRRFCLYEEKDLADTDYVLMLFWMEGEHGMVEWVLFNSDPSIFHTGVPVHNRTVSQNYGEGLKTYPGNGFYTTDAIVMSQCRLDAI